MNNKNYWLPDINNVHIDSQVLKKLNNSTILITGATGLVGSTIVRFLMMMNSLNKMNSRIIAQVRTKEKARYIFGEMLDSEEILLLEQSVTEPINIYGSLDYIIHTASPTSSLFFVEHPVETIMTSITGTYNILELARVKNSKGIVYLSSMEVFGTPNSSLKDVSEKDLGYIDIGSVRSSYPEGKRLCECLCASYAKEYSIPVTVARLAQTFGASVNIKENRVFAQFAKSIINKTDIVLHTDGQSEGNYCYTGDVVSAILLLLVRGKPGEAYTVCNEETNITIADMAEMVAKRFGNDKVQVIFDIPDDENTYGYAPKVKMKLSSNKLRALGWEPTVALEEMYGRLITSFQQQMEQEQ